MENDSSQFINDPSEPPAPWFQVPRAFIRNPNLSFEAKGLMTYLMSHSGNWNISIPYIIKTQNISKNVIYKIINECIENGYLKRETYSEKGLQRFKYFVSPTGRFKKSLPYPEKQDPVKQDPVNQDTKIYQSSSKEEEKIDQLEEHSLSYSLSQESECVSFGSHVKIKKEDYENFCKDYGKQNIDLLVEEMKDWISSRGRTYKDYTAEIRNWIRRRKWSKGVTEEAEVDQKPVIYEPNEEERAYLMKREVSKVNFNWVDDLMRDKENRPYLNSLRFMLHDFFCEAPEIPESRVYYDSPGFKPCVQSVLQKLKTKDYTQNFGAYDDKRSNINC